MKQLTHGSLFAGIGGFDLGFERAGIKTVWQVEIDPFCRKVLERHWPNVQRFGDIRECRDLPRVDVLSGGFPCQDVSVANYDGEGLDGERSGLWFEYERTIRELRPRIIVVENVPNLLNRGFGRVLGGLAELGYDAEWILLPAAAFGAPHLRWRIWIVAYPSGSRYGSILQPQRQPEFVITSDSWRDGEVQSVANSNGQGLEGWNGGSVPECAGQQSSRPRSSFANAHSKRQLQPQGSQPEERGRFGDGGWWRVEPDVGRVAHGIPARVDRLKGLGNAVVPQIAEWIGRRIIEAESVS